MHAPADTCDDDVRLAAKMATLGAIRAYEEVNRHVAK
jgi:hypothetical protein